MTQNRPTAFSQKNSPDLCNYRSGDSKKEVICRKTAAKMDVLYQTANVLRAFGGCAMKNDDTAVWYRYIITGQMSQNQYKKYKN